MRIHVGPIKGTRGASLATDFSQRIPSPWEQGDAETVPVRLHAKVTNTGRCYVVQGELSADATLSCNRCLESVTVPIETSFEEEFYAESKQHSSRRADDDEDADGADVDDEANTFEGDAFSLDDVAREYLVLALPIRVTCRDDCAGICPTCGQNRNVAACECRDENVDPRMAGLLGLLDRKRE